MCIELRFASGSAQKVPRNREHIFNVRSSQDYNTLYKISIEKYGLLYIKKN